MRSGRQEPDANNRAEYIEQTDMQKLLSSKYGWLALIVLLVLVNLLAGRLYYRLDLTREKRYTLSAPTINLLSKLDDDVEVDFFLQGDLKAGIRQLSKNTQELLQEFN